MKTSQLLLLVLAVLMLSGMITSDLLLKSGYERIDWRNRYQEYASRPLPLVRHLVIDGSPVREITIEQSTEQRALISPDDSLHFRTEQRGDTLVLSFTPPYEGERNKPGDVAGQELKEGVVVRLLSLQSLRASNARITLRRYTLPALTIGLANSRLRTDRVAVSGTTTLLAYAGSYAVLGADRYQSLRVSLPDSGGGWFMQADIGQLQTTASAQAELRFRGPALRWAGVPARR